MLPTGEQALPLSCCLQVSPSAVMLPTGEPFQCHAAYWRALPLPCCLLASPSTVMLPIGERFHCHAASWRALPLSCRLLASPLQCPVTGAVAWFVAVLCPTRKPYAMSSVVCTFCAFCPHKRSLSKLIEDAALAMPPAQGSRATCIVSADLPPFPRIVVYQPLSPVTFCCTSIAPGMITHSLLQSCAEHTRLASYAMKTGWWRHYRCCLA